MTNRNLAGVLLISGGRRILVKRHIKFAYLKRDSSAHDAAGADVAILPGTPTFDDLNRKGEGSVHQPSVKSNIFRRFTLPGRR